MGPGQHGQVGAGMLGTLSYDTDPDPAFNLLTNMHLAFFVLMYPHPNFSAIGSGSSLF